MKVGEFVRWIAPPILVDLLRGTQQGHSASPLWEGVYKHHRDVPVAGPRFDGDTWVKQTQTYTRGTLAASAEAGTIPTGVVGEHLLLPLVASLLCNQTGRRINILDFGGGMGVSYIHLMSSLANCSSITYHVVEREPVCLAGKQLFQTDNNIQFLSEVPSVFPDLDIIYISSALQYVEDYTTLLKKLAALRARYFLFVKLSAGDFPTYATAQKNVPGTVLPYWFINVREIVATMDNCGYTLVYKSALEQEYDQRNFAVEYRMGRTCNLLFSRN